jgi:hypothetical protein
MLRELLGRDATGEVDPIHDSTKLILRSFINFVITDFTSYQEERRAKRDMAYTNKHRALAIEHNITDRARELVQYLKNHTSVDFDVDKIDKTNARFTRAWTESHGVHLAASIAHRKGYSVRAAIRRRSAAKADREQLVSIARRLELEVHQTDKYACLPDYDRPLTSREEVVEAVSLLKVKLDSLSNE